MVKTGDILPGEVIKILAGLKWESSEFTCQPFQHYKLTFYSKAERQALYTVFYYDKEGDFITADTYGSINPSEKWMENIVTFRGRENAVKSRIGFINPDVPPSCKAGILSIDKIEIKEATFQEMIDWADNLYTAIPPLLYRAEPGRWQYIQETMRRLRQGGIIRMVMLGDSIINDTSNSNFEVLIERIYTKVDMRVITSVRGSTGCWYYHEPENFQSYIVNRKPDLLFIGGISHKNDIDAVRKVVTMTRKTLGCDIIIASGPLGVDWRSSEEAKEGEYIPEVQSDWPHEWEKQLAGLSKELKVEYFDMATPWHRYLAQSAKPKGWFHRDRVHANDRGKQVLARLLEIFFMRKTGNSR